MSCEKCKRFPAPTSVFDEIAHSIERHGTIYRCKYCGIYYEIIEGNRSFNIMNEDEAIKFYKIGSRE